MIDPARQLQSRNKLNPAAFTLVELLVVIGIIALLISILLPALSKAKAQANNIKCLSNVRQLVMATKLFAADHKGCAPTSSSDAASPTNVVRMFDPYHQKFLWRSTSAGAPFVADWASSLLLYLGFRDNDVNSFENQNESPTPGWSPPKIFICPNDPAQDGPNPGYQLYNNVTVGTTGGNFPVSYGINADITCLNNTGGSGQFDLGSAQDQVAGGPGALQCQLDRVAYSSTTLLFADCCVRPQTTQAGNPLNWCNTLYYATNGLQGVLSGSNAYLAYTLQGVAGVNSSSSYMASRIPLKRHGNKINVGFVDGHAATVPAAGSGGFNTVRVSPYKN